MEQLLHKQKVTITGTALNATEEYVLSGDFILPEYCPDVAVVLKCVVTPQLQSRRWNGDTFTVDGMAVIRVLYLDEERSCVREAEFTQPINCAMRGQNGCEGLPVQVQMTQDYVNCRAVSPRRIEMRGGFTICARAEQACCVELPCAAQEQRLYTKELCRAVSAPLSSGEKVITVNETLAFDSGLPAAEQLLGGDCVAAITDMKLLTDKAIVKGQIYLHQLYTDDSVGGTSYVLDYTVPFSAIMDVEGVRDGHLHTAQVCVLSDTEECVTGAAGPNTALGFSAKLLVQLWTYETAEAHLVTDAYHADCPTTLNREMLSICSLTGAFRQTAPLQKSVAVPCEGLHEIIDAWATPLSVNGRVEKGRVMLDVPMLISLLVRDQDGAIAYYERAEDFGIDCAQTVSCQDESTCFVQAQITVTGFSYAAIGDSIDLRINVIVAAQLRECLEMDVVREITLQKDNVYAKDAATLRLYYAEAGESVWDIACRCHTSPLAVQEENGLQHDVLPAKTVLLIPVE